MNKNELFNSIIYFFSSVIDKVDELTKHLDLKDLTKIQYKILELIYFNPNSTPSEISHCLNLNMPNTSRELSKLELAGLIKKTIEPKDRRKVYISLSDTGLIFMEHVLAQIKQQFLASTPHLSEEDITQLLQAITVIQSKLLISKKSSI